MRAIVFDQPGDESVLHLGDVPAPPLGANDVRIRVRATAVNRADLLQRQGLYPPPPGASAVLGLECGGEIAEVGSAVRGWTVGERAMALLAGGGYAEQAVVDAGSVLRVPEALSDEEGGAFAEVFLTAFLNLFMLGAVPDGGSVLVHGGGSGVGTAAITLCRVAGVRILVTAGSEEKCERCLAHGADAAINYRRGDFAPAVRDATGGRGVDVVLDAIGGRYLESNLAALAIGGRLVVIGLMGGARGELDLAGLMVKRQQIIGSTLRTRPAAEKAAIVQAFVARFGAALAAGRIRPVIDRVLPLEHAAEAHRIMKASEHFGKIALRVS
ncbi:NAD(P)H-quinone oxidoreductase [bacterium]|nr:NAD(P)H-quinone oxidoreductase [bacterium]